MKGIISKMAAIAAFLATFFSAELCRGQEIDNEFRINSLHTLDSMPIYHPQSDVIRPLSLFKQDLVNNYGFNGFTHENGRGFHLESLRFPGKDVAPGTAFIPLWKNTGISASGSISTYPGLMEIHKGSVGVTRQIGKLTLYGGMTVNKYGYFNGLHTQYGFSGMIKYSLSPKLTLNGYATYYLGQPPVMGNGMPMPQAMLGYYGMSTYGATFDYQINETFGLIVGGQAVKQIGMNSYRFEPIVTPTFKIGKVKIGLPVGQILNEYLREQIDRKRFSPMGRKK